MNRDDLKELGVVRVATPCNKRFEDLEGEGPRRFCRDCKLHVYDFAQLSSSEARALLVETEGRLCGRIFTRADGTVLTRDCPVGLARVKRWLLAKVSAVGAVLAVLLTGGVAWRTARTATMGAIAGPVPGRLEVGPSPWRKVFIDGQPVGGGGMSTPLRPGQHEVVLESENGLRKTQEVFIASGQTTRIE